ncbi:MAG: hypothetical protein EPN23_05100 [Verrucomicrobia bacterium]|nr:MAG: hypothetical protein EPN23_05100 [Verrucomicrobiota bacterium]
MTVKRTPSSSPPNASLNSFLATAEHPASSDYAGHADLHGWKNFHHEAHEVRKVYLATLASWQFVFHLWKAVFICDALSGGLASCGFLREFRALRGEI